MNRYKIFETNTFLRELKKLISPYEERLIIKKLTRHIYPQLRYEPHYGNNIKKLKDYQPETWRYRTGNLRLFYSLDEKNKVVIITSIRFRKEAYR